MIGQSIQKQDYHILSLTACAVGEIGILLLWCHFLITFSDYLAQLDSSRFRASALQPPLELLGRRAFEIDRLHFCQVCNIV